MKRKDERVFFNDLICPLASHTLTVSNWWP